MAHKKKPDRTEIRNKTPTPYFSLKRNPEEKSADIYIFGNIAQNKGGLSGLLQSSSDQSSYDLANQVAGIPEDWEITVHVNSNGGELKEGLGIYNVLKARNVTTICEGFAASAGSLVFCAGRTRIMQPASLLFIHQAQMDAAGNADDFQKAAEDLRIVTEAAVAAYREAGVNISDEELDAMLKAETWITPEEAVEYGFATQISEPEEEENGVIVNDAMRSVMAAVKRPYCEITELKTTEGVQTEKILDVMRAFSETAKEYTEIFSLAEKALEMLRDNPGLVPELKEVVSLVLEGKKKQKAGQQDTGTGFFGFGR